ncbi:MAG: acetyl/propionyl/methylcrotonyl-CoA carboxylase subunit alpha [Myxococcota bacterium]
MFRKILIANRGEIAVRIARACRELGVPSVSIFSDADRDALHVRVADEAMHCGPAPARESYLDADRVIAAARAAGADAIHPGYGFLSENGDFADRCADEEIAFIGPSSDVLRSMGDKITSRQMAQRAGVPIVPGATEIVSPERARDIALDVGFPVMVKASAGGGGRGLRRVDGEAELAAAFERARSEAAASFGDAGVYIEKVVEPTRHIEIQILADRYGNAVHLFERECSIQRRHQKLVEEAPANGLSDDLRERMSRAALAMVRAVGYVGAGTCEFLLDAFGAFTFLEMNTRVQVEHAVTEEITGVDIVKQMIRIGAGEPLDLDPAVLAIRGHSIEARIYAEDPARGFLPCPGKIAAYRPPGGFGVRVDSGVQSGSTVSVHYDPMLAKLVVWGGDRTEAIARLERALAEFRIDGIRTTLPFHRAVARHPAFRAGHYDTGFVDAHWSPDGAGSVAERRSALQVARVVAAAALHDRGEAGDEFATISVAEKSSGTLAVALRATGPGRYEARCGDEPVHFDVVLRAGASASVLADGAQCEASVTSARNGSLDVESAGYTFRFELA